MDSVTVLAIVVIVLALGFDFINGFHDTANAIATVIATRVLKPQAAILMAAVLNLIGALLTGTGVALAIAKGVVNPDLITMNVLIGGLVGAILWNLATWYFGIPSSSSHALIGGLAGSAIAAAGPGAINLGGFKSIVLSFLISPAAGLVLGLIFMNLLNFILRNASNQGVTRVFSKLQIVSAAAMAYSHGSNDAQKSMAIIAVTLYSAKITTTLHVPFWVVVAAALAMGLGTSVGGWRIIRTLGHKMVKLHPANGFVAETAAAIIIESFTRMKLPVSTTHVISSTVLSVGAAKGVRGVNWGVVKNIAWAMVLTLPATALVGAVGYWLTQGVLKLFM